MFAAFLPSNLTQLLGWGLILEPKLTTPHRMLYRLVCVALVASYATPLRRPFRAYSAAAPPSTAASQPSALHTCSAGGYGESRGNRVRGSVL